jgi:effector-binding domain-containing protein
MQFLDNQMLMFSNLLSYKTNVKYKDIPRLLEYIRDNLNVLGISPKNRTIFTLHGENRKQEDVEIEVLIPVNGRLNDVQMYNFKTLFKLINAVSVRHEGDFSLIPKTREGLLRYIEQKNYESVTDPYYRIIRLGTGNDCIIDIYIGINSNIL